MFERQADERVIDSHILCISCGIKQHTYLLLTFLLICREQVFYFFLLLFRTILPTRSNFHTTVKKAWGLFLFLPLCSENEKLLDLDFTLFFSDSITLQELHKVVLIRVNCY